MRHLIDPLDFSKEEVEQLLDLADRIIADPTAYQEAVSYTHLGPPAKIPVREACLIGPFTVGFRAARCVEPKPGENALVFGAGTIGIAAAISRSISV